MQRSPYNGRGRREAARTLNGELLAGTTFETADELRAELAPACCATTRRACIRFGGKSPSSPCRSVNELLDIYSSREGGNLAASRAYAAWAVYSLGRQGE